VDYRVDFGIENGTEFDTIFCGTSHSCCYQHAVNYRVKFDVENEVFSLI